MILGKNAWSYITFVYIFFSAVYANVAYRAAKRYITTLCFYRYLIVKRLGTVVRIEPSCIHGKAEQDVVYPFRNSCMWYCLGFSHSLLSRTCFLRQCKMKRIPKSGYGAMVLGKVLAVLALCVAGAAAGRRYSSNMPISAIV